MCTVKGGKNGSNTFGEGWGTFPPTFPHPKGRIWRDLGGGMFPPTVALVWEE